MQSEIFLLFDRAVEGDKEALEGLILSVQDMIYNLSLRMLGMPCDAEDATQEIIIKVITQLSAFRKESAFSTWVYRIAANYLINYKKSMFAQHQLSFEFYGLDIDNGFIHNTNQLTQNVDENLLAEELKHSCTNVMLQCLDPESRLIYVLGVMFKVDSKICGEILEISPEAYRQRLSRIRKQVGEFLSEYCGLSQTGKCNCKKRVGYAIHTRRLDPQNLEYSNMSRADENTILNFTQAMEEMDQMSFVFAQLPKYRSPDVIHKFIKDLLDTYAMRVIAGNAGEEITV
ncbi:RNA polymerase sigma factor [Lacrimispora sp. 38-1]|uniref:RNA polymerase sigma factor n=1 Tax=Lacrimispora sp. 38-1 TaxID=3125778 RepID=UPI003CF13B19